MFERIQVVAPGAVQSYSAKSALFTASASDQGTFYESTGTFTITLSTTGMSAGWSAWFRTVSGTQTFDPSGAVTINGAATYAVSNAGDVVLVVFDGTNFQVSHTQRPSTVAITGGTINGTAIGGTTAAAGAFTTLTASGLFTLPVATGTHTISSTTASTSGTTGALTVAGGVGIAGKLHVATASDDGPRFQVLGEANTYAAGVYGNSTSGQSFGLRIEAGTNSSDLAFRVRNQADTLTRFDVRGDGVVSIPTGIASTNTTTGALVVTGGVGVSGSLFAVGIEATTLSVTSTGTSSFTTAGRANVAGQLLFTADSSFIGNNNAHIYREATDGLVFAGYNGATNAISLYNNLGQNVFSVPVGTRSLSLSSTTASTSTTTGALIVAGGLGLAGAFNAGGLSTISVNSASALFVATSTATSGAAAGAFLATACDDGAAMASGDRLGGIFLRGARDASSTMTNAAGILAYATEAWGAAASGARLSIEVCAAGSVTRTEVARFQMSATAAETALFIYDVDNATLERVTVGAADSGGVGFKVLRIPN